MFEWRLSCWWGSRRRFCGNVRAERQEARQALATTLERVGARGHRVLDRLGCLDHGDRDRANRGQCLDPCRRDATADRDASDAGLLRTSRHAERGLADRRLLVDATFAGDDEI